MTSIESQQIRTDFKSSPESFSGGSGALRSGNLSSIAEPFDNDGKPSDAALGAAASMCDLESPKRDPTGMSALPKTDDIALDDLELLTACDG